MSDARLPTEVELVFEVMPSQALRVAQEPGATQGKHPCSYFRQWGTYHSYDYMMSGAPDKRGIQHDIEYLGRAPLVPELLSGCRKAPILAVGINPNLPGWWRATRNSLNPFFQEYRQYAHYFRYRAKEKLQIPRDDYQKYLRGVGGEDTPFSGLELKVPADAEGRRRIKGQLQPQKMYQEYEGLLKDLGQQMGWNTDKFALGEDLAYGNMVACPSAKWTTRRDPNDPQLPPMTVEQRDGIVDSCFHERKFFLRQLFQSLPPVILLFSQSTANAFIGEFEKRFSQGNPRVGEPIRDLAGRHIRLAYGPLNDGTTLDARVIFSPHITGNPSEYGPARKRLLDQLLEEARAERLTYSAATGHLSRSRGACVFCPMLEIGPCDYVSDLKPLIGAQIQLTADSSPVRLVEEKSAQSALRELVRITTARAAWDAADESEPAPAHRQPHDAVS